MNVLNRDFAFLPLRRSTKIIEKGSGLFSSIVLSEARQSALLCIDKVLWLATTLRRSH
jgi:hypothetical protein